MLKRDWRDVADERDPQIRIDRELVPCGLGSAEYEAMPLAREHRIAGPLSTADRRALVAGRNLRRARGAR